MLKKQPDLDIHIDRTIMRPLIFSAGAVWYYMGSITVLMVSRSLGNGGVPQVIHDISRWLVKHGVSVRVCYFEDPAESVGVRDHVRFVGHVENPYTIYWHADVAAFSSESEGFSIGLLEAMAIGVPIIATDIPPFREALGEDYPLVPTRNPKQLGVELSRRLSRKEESAELASDANRRVHDCFSGDRCADAHLSFYKSII